MVNTRGFYGVGIYHGKHEENQGTLWRSAYNFGAAFIFTIGKRFQKQAADTPKAYHHVPMYNYTDMDDFVKHLPHACPIIGVELVDDAISLDKFSHPERCIYLLGAEDHGLPQNVLEWCHAKVVVPGAKNCLNVATAGSIVMYDRLTAKMGTKTQRRTLNAGFDNSVSDSKL